MGRHKKIPKQQLPVRYAFQRELLGDLSFDYEKDRHRNSRYLLRNIKRVLRHHEKRFIRNNALKSKETGLGKNKSGSLSLSTRQSLSFGGDSSRTSVSDAQKGSVEQDVDFPAFADYVKADTVSLYVSPFSSRQQLRLGQSALLLNITQLRAKTHSDGEPALASHSRRSYKCSISVSLLEWNAERLHLVAEQSRRCTLIMNPSSKDIEVNLEQPFKFGIGISMGRRYHMEIRLSPAGDDTSHWPPVAVTTRTGGSSLSLMTDPQLQIFPDGLLATYTDLEPRKRARGRVEVMYANRGTVYKTRHKLEISIDWAAAAPSQISAQTTQRPSESRMSTRRTGIPGSAGKATERFTPTMPEIARVVTSYTMNSAEDQKIATEWRKVKFKGLHCPFCLRTHTDFDDILALRFHLITAHAAHKFVLQEMKPSVRGREATTYSFKVSAAAQKVDKFAFRWPFTWVAPRTPFDISTFVDGDESWLGARSVSGVKEPVAPVESPIEALRRKHNGFLPARYVEDIPIRPRKKYPVVATRTRDKLTLFDSITHRPLQPDEELSESEDEFKETWLRDKHAQRIMDEENEPLETRLLWIRWNDHLKSEGMRNPSFASDAFVRWVRKDREWLKSSAERLETYHVFSRQLWEAGKINAVVGRQCREIIYLKTPAEKTETAVPVVTEMDGT